MKTLYKTILLSLTLLAICLGCTEECNDCLELTTKNIRYVDSDGANLLFGNQAIYDPDSVIIRAGNDNILGVWKQEDTGTLLFNLEPNSTIYTIILSDTLTDSLEFELAERKSTSCCGNVTYSTKTFLNGKEVSNDDLIVITN